MSEENLSKADQQVVQDEADATVRDDATNEAAQREVQATAKVLWEAEVAFERSIATLPAQTQEVERQRRKDAA